MGPCRPQGCKDALVLNHAARPRARGGLLALELGTEAWTPERSLSVLVGGGGCGHVEGILGAAASRHACG